MEGRFKTTMAVTMSRILAICCGLYYTQHNEKTHVAGNNISKISNPENGEGKRYNSNNSAYNWEGNYIYFWHYPQSLKSGVAINSTNPDDFNKDPIKWRILEKNNAA